MTKRLDKIGIVASTACAVHCALTPVAAMLVGGGLGFLSNSEDWHRAFVVGTLFLGLFSVIVGLRRHRDYRALALVLIAGSVGVLTEVFHHDLEKNAFLHGAAFAVMGTLMVIAHMLNLKLSHGHIHDSQCHHKDH